MSNQTTQKRPRRRSAPKHKKTRDGVSVKLLLILLLMAYCLGFATCYVVQPILLAEKDSAVQGDPEKETSGDTDAGAVEKAVQEVLEAEEEKREAVVTPSEPEPAPEPTAHDQASALLQDMTLEEKIYQMFIVTQEQLTGFSGTVTQSGETSQTAVREKPVGGIIYFQENLVNPTQVISMIDNIQNASRLGLFIAVDEEGGRVSRLGSNREMNVTSFPSMMEVGDQGEDAVKKATETIGSEIKELGFNLDFAPVADVYTNQNNSVIGDRALSTDPEKASVLVRSAVSGFRESGMLCTLKHFPGHGDTSGDSHSSSVYLYGDLEKLEDNEFRPFKAGIDAGADVVMIGHITVPDVTGTNEPATVSKQMITDVLRGDLGFEGIVVTDAMNMSAITNLYDSGFAAVKAIQAGVDIILMPADFSSAFSGVLGAVQDGRISIERIDESVLRILETKIRQGIVNVG